MVYRDCRELHTPERYNERETHFYPVLIAFNSKTPPFSDLTQTDKWPNGQTDLQTDGDGVRWTLFSLYLCVRVHPITVYYAYASLKPKY